MLPLRSTPKDALADFINALEQSFLRWYERSLARYRFGWTVLQTVSLTSGFVTAVLAALMTEEAFKGLNWGRLALVILPATGAAVSQIAVQAKLYDLFQMRERGRASVQELSLEGRRRFAEANNEQEYAAIHKELETRLNQIEAEQGQGFFSFIRS